MQLGMITMQNEPEDIILADSKYRDEGKNMMEL